MAQILVKELPYAAAVHQDFFDGSVCFCCFKSAPKNARSTRFNACSGCKMAYYCGSDCQKKDWETKQHSFECKGFQHLESSEREIAVNSPLIRLVARIYARRSKDGGDPEESEGELLVTHASVTRRKLGSLLSNSEQWCDGENAYSFTNFCAMFKAVYARNPWFTQIPLADLRELYGVVKTNSFGISASQGVYGGEENLGIGLYLQASRFDHSCDPGLERLSEGALHVISAVRPLDLSSTKIAIDSLKLNYFPLFGVSLTRQRARVLTEKFLFSCQCSLCSDSVSDTIKRFAAVGSCTKCNSCMIIDPGMEEPLRKCVKCDEAVRLDTNGHLSVVKLLKKFEKSHKFPFEAPPSFGEKEERDLAIAEKWLHPVRNVVLLQLREQKALSFAGDDGIFPRLSGDKKERQEELNKLGQLYFKILLSYEFYKVKNVLHAAACAVLGKMCQMQEDHKKAIYWFQKARDLWKSLAGEEYRCVKELEYLMGLSE